MTTKKEKTLLLTNFIILLALTISISLFPMEAYAAPMANTDHQTATTVPSPMYGDQKSYIKIGIYTDYMSKESMHANEAIAPLIPKLAKYASIYFIEIPKHHQQSMLFSEAFLSVHLANPRDINIAMKTRSLLFQAATLRPTADPIAVLKKNGIAYTMDTKAIGTIFKQFYIPLMMNDRVEIEPVLIIHKSQQRYTYYGAKQMEEGLNTLLQSFSMTPTLQKER